MATAASVVGRASAALTTSLVYGADCDMSDCLDGFVTVDLSFTKTSLTSMTMTLYAGPAATPTDPLYVNGVKQEYVFTADTEGCFVVPTGGARYFRAGLQGVGTVAGSAAAFNYLYNDYESTSRVDGHPQIG